MIAKCLEKEILLFPDVDDEMIENPFKLEYYLLESEIWNEHSLKYDNVYGVEIIKTTGDNNSERECIRNLSNSREKARRILDKLALNLVTPVGLLFVIDDMLGVNDDLIAC